MNQPEAKHGSAIEEEVAPRWQFTRDEQHAVARLEGFTDVIFGFSIFMLATNLKVPDKAEELVEQQFEFFVFFLNFAFIAALWWQHHRIFAHYFRPTTPAIIVHLVFLGCTAMLTYPLQLYLRYHRSLIVIQTYLAGFALVYFLQTLLLLLGRSSLNEQLSRDRKARGLVFAGISGSLAVMSLVCLTLTLFLGPAGTLPMCLIPVLVIVVRRGLRRRMLPVT